MSRASGARITLASYEEMLGGSPREQAELDIRQLQPYPNHPFTIYAAITVQIKPAPATGSAKPP